VRVFVIIINFQIAKDMYLFNLAELLAMIIFVFCTVQLFSFFFQQKKRKKMNVQKVQQKTDLIMYDALHDSLCKFCE